jgi:NAD(P)H-hydrate repair Nnr-like enzyme with NAD(P)H-hydrate epimerase domain
MRLALREEMQEIDRRATLDFGLSPEQLMEQAGAKMAQEILAFFADLEIMAVMGLLSPGN